MIRVGTCGYAYKDWIGPFYPGKTRQDEMLSYYSACFSAVEIDTTYYGVLAARTVERMAARTPQTFRFCFKAPASVTHAPPAAWSRLHDDAAAFRESLRPMTAAGKLGAVLLQFPGAFKPDAASRAYLSRLGDAFEGLPVVVEFRTREWQTAQTHALLRELRVGWCNVDMPALEMLLHPSADTTSDIGYVRLHGRNAAQWWTGDAVTRYAYNYTEPELAPWADRVAEIEREANATYVFFNNHARWAAPRNAEVLLRLLRERYGEDAERVLGRRPSVPAQGTFFPE